jgi:hypothetical protein
MRPEDGSRGRRIPQAPVTELGRRVSTLLVFRPGQPICAGSAARVLGVASKAVHEAMVKLEARPRMRRGYGVCDTCGKTRLVTVAVRLAPEPSPPAEPEGT